MHFITLTFWIWRETRLRHQGWKSTKQNLAHMKSVLIVLCAQVFACLQVSFSSQLSTFLVLQNVSFHQCISQNSGHTTRNGWRSSVHSIIQKLQWRNVKHQRIYLFRIYIYQGEQDFSCVLKQTSDRTSDFRWCVATFSGCLGSSARS